LFFEQMVFEASIMIRKNDEGELLLNITAVAAEVIPNFTRYNGGWIKRVTGVDETKTDGYSLIGDFTKTGLTWHQPGVYLDCSIGGSRKNQAYRYSLFILQPDGVGKYLGITETRLGRGGDWAPHFWDAVAAALQKIGAGTPGSGMFPSSNLRTLFELEEMAVMAQSKGFSSALDVIKKQIELLKNQQNEEE